MTIPEGSFDNNIRPYTIGFREREEHIAHIVLYTGAQGVSSEKSKDVEYTMPTNRVKVERVLPAVNRDTDKGSLKDSPTQVATLQNTNQGLYYGIFNNFSLIEVSESKDSIVKLHQNFGDSWNLFFFGDSPSAYTFRGVFLDTWEYPYYEEFMTMYGKFLEGRKCVENGWKMKIHYDGKIVGGYLINIKTSISADQPHTKAFSFTMIVTDDNFLRKNAVVNGNEFTGESVYQQMNNSHRVVRQYPSLISSEVVNTRVQSTSINTNQSIDDKMRGKSEQDLYQPPPTAIT